MGSHGGSGYAQTKVCDLAGGGAGYARGGGDRLSDCDRGDEVGAGEESNG